VQWGPGIRLDVRTTVSIGSVPGVVLSVGVARCRSRRRPPHVANVQAPDYRRCGQRGLARASARSRRTDQLITPARRELDHLCPRTGIRRSSCGVSNSCHTVSTTCSGKHGFNSNSLHPAVRAASRTRSTPHAVTTRIGSAASRSRVRRISSTPSNEPGTRRPVMSNWHSANFDKAASVVPASVTRNPCARRYSAYMRRSSVPAYARRIVAMFWIERGGTPR